MITVYRSFLDQLVWYNTLLKKDDQFYNRIQHLAKTIDLPECNNFLLIGKVQSGKTMTFIGLMSALFDIGYSIAVVLSGTKVNLHEQTLERIRSEFKYLNIDVISDKDVDLNSKLYYANNERRRVVIVCLKNSVRLQKLDHNLSGIDASKSVLIDDESDQASLNNYNFVNSLSFSYKESSTFGSVYNLVRNHRFKFVQVTATPGAHFLTDYLDVFKPDYFALIPPHANYLGGNYFFDNQLENSVEIITGEDDLLDFELKQFLLEFLSKSVALYNAEISNISALIHGDSRMSVNENYALLVSQLIVDLKDDIPEKLMYWPNLPSRDYLQNNSDILALILDRLKIQRVFGKHDKRIDWKKFYQENRYFILVGGAKLERGFTIEGLITSYVPRTSKNKGNADTIQQRARFFGSKHHIRKYCKVFMTRKLMYEFIEYAQNEQYLFDNFEGVNKVIDTTEIFNFELTNPCRKSVISSIKHFIKGKWQHIYVFNLVDELYNEIWFNSSYLGIHELSGQTVNRTHLILEIERGLLISLLSNKDLYQPKGYFGNSEDFGRLNAKNCRQLLKLFEQDEVIRFIKLGGEFETVRSYSSKSVKGLNTLIPKAVHSGRSKDGAYLGDHKILLPSMSSRTTLHLQLAHLDESENNKMMIISVLYDSEF